MLSGFLLYLKGQNIDIKSTKILLAVSGGVDSMVMAHLFLKAKCNFNVAHVNHNTRGTESEGDLQHVKRWCQNHSIDFFQKTLDKDFSKFNNFQARARQIRRAWMEDIAAKNHCNYIATAHHQDDALETFFINMQRGGGLKGLSGLKGNDGMYIKPLLFTNKEQIIDYAKTENIAFRHDASNDEDTYLRNQIRHRLLSHWPDSSMKVKMIESIHNLHDSYRQLKQYILSDKFIVRYEKNCMVIDRIALMKKESALTCLQTLLEEYDFKRSQLTDMLGASQNGATFYSTSGEVIFDRGFLYLMPSEDEFNEREIHDYGEYKLANGSILKLSRIEPSQIDFNSGNLYLSFAENPFPLYLRKHHIGDLYEPLGMQGKRQMVSDFITNTKLNPIEKRKLFIITKQDRICAIIPYRICDWCKVTDTKQIVIEVNIR
jgi:tRNA(Ile)-lysidine synthase